MGEQQFRIGEVAIITDACVYEHLRGTECTVVGFDEWVNNHGHRINCQVQAETGVRYGCDWRIHLRKKPSPREDLEIVRWADVPWQPSKVTP